jgi:hypothetical protein
MIDLSVRRRARVRGRSRPVAARAAMIKRNREACAGPSAAATNASSANESLRADLPYGCALHLRLDAVPLDSPSDDPDPSSARAAMVRRNHEAWTKPRVQRSRQ